MSPHVTCRTYHDLRETRGRPARDPRRAVVPHLLNADTLCIVKDAVALNQQATILHVFGELVNW